MDYYQDKEIARMRERIEKLEAAMRLTIKIINYPVMHN